ncbi:malonyl-CoA decarboxylase-domain-containing protein [Pilaira anomala]|nr:malonyl-CoA decarboxylase-domain-containing protein [Pilaira anomala]
MQRFVKVISPFIIKRQTAHLQQYKTIFTKPANTDKVVFNTKETTSVVPEDRLFMHELLEKITENNNSLPPPVFTEKCCDFFKQLDKNSKKEFFKILSTEFNRVNAVKEAKEYISLGKSNVTQAEKNLLHYLDHIRQLPNGLKLLVDMRADLLNIMGSRDSPEYLEFASLEEDIRLKLKTYIIGFLKLERITWQKSSAELLEKICDYEAVHAVHDWKDIKRRLGPDRRVFAFFENNVPNEPLAFVHVALVPEISSSVQDILNEPLPTQNSINTEKFICAICYSITTQKGLGGINLGNYLIKQVVNNLKNEFTQLETFATLSPMPGFRKWLLHHAETDTKIQAELGPEWKTKLNRFNKQDQKQLKDPLMKLCSRYILSEKRIEKNALDPVANFHLRNGACAHQIHWQADTSEKGIQESFGIMINYNYILDRLESNRRLYLLDGTISKAGFLIT